MTLKYGYAFFVSVTPPKKEEIISFFNNSRVQIFHFPFTMDAFLLVDPLTLDFFLYHSDETECHSMREKLRGKRDNIPMYDILTSTNKPTYLFIIFSFF